MNFDTQASLAHIAAFASEPATRSQEACGKCVEFLRREFPGFGDKYLVVPACTHALQIRRLACKWQAQIQSLNLNFLAFNAESQGRAINLNCQGVHWCVFQAMR